MEALRREYGHTSIFQLIDAQPLCAIESIDISVISEWDTLPPTLEYGIYTIPEHLIDSLRLYQYAFCTDIELYMKLIPSGDYVHPNIKITKAIAARIIEIRPDFIPELPPHLIAPDTYFNYVKMHGIPHEIQKLPMRLGKNKDHLMYYWHLEPSLLKRGAMRSFFTRDILEEFIDRYPNRSRTYRKLYKFSGPITPKPRTSRSSPTYEQILYQIVTQPTPKGIPAHMIDEKLADQICQVDPLYMIDNENMHKYITQPMFDKYYSGIFIAILTLPHLVTKEVVIKYSLEYNQYIQQYADYYDYDIVTRIIRKSPSQIMNIADISIISFLVADDPNSARYILPEYLAQISVKKSAKY